MTQRVRIFRVKRNEKECNRFTDIPSRVVAQHRTSTVNEKLAGWNDLLPRQTEMEISFTPLATPSWSTSERRSINNDRQEKKDGKNEEGAQVLKNKLAQERVVTTVINFGVFVPKFWTRHSFKNVWVKDELKTVKIIIDHCRCDWQISEGSILVNNMFTNNLKPLQRSTRTRNDRVFKACYSSPSCFR